MSQNVITIASDESSPAVTLSITIAEPSTVARLHTILGARGVTPGELATVETIDPSRQNVIGRAFADSLVSGG